jgi:hypothetical protein
MLQCNINVAMQQAIAYIKPAIGRMKSQGDLAV